MISTVAVYVCYLHADKERQGQVRVILTGVCEFCDLIGTEVLRHEGDLRIEIVAGGYLSHETIVVGYESYTSLVDVGDNLSHHVCDTVLLIGHGSYRCCHLASIDWASLYTYIKSNVRVKYKLTSSLMRPPLPLERLAPVA